MRISAYEWVEGSIEFPDVLAFSRMAERYVDMIQVSSGIDKNTVANVHCITTNLEPEMTNLGWARQVKRAVSIPVSVVGAFMTPQVAEDALARNDVDAVAFGRTLIADPDWPRKAMEGRPEDIVPCLRCNNCYHIASDHWNVGCSVNPHYHNESFVPKGIARADTGRNVVILGAGPGGMRAAITAFDRGHRVTLVEREDEPGGMLRFIARESHKSEVARLLGHYRAQLAKRDIRVMLGCEATPELVRALEPEALGIAIGATERRPGIEGIDGPKVLLATETIMCTDELEGRIVILGGGSIGCELALELAERGRQVLVIEMAHALAGNANALYREALRQKFELHPNIKVALGNSCTKVSAEHVEYADDAGRRQKAAYDHMIVSVGFAPQTDLVERFHGIVPDTATIGDCVRPSSIMNANFEGHTFALNI